MEISQIKLGDEFCRYQMVHLDHADLKPLYGTLNSRTLQAMTELFRKRLMAGRKGLGTLILFSVHEHDKDDEDDEDLPFDSTYKGTRIYSKGALARVCLNSLAAEGKIRVLGEEVSCDIPAVDKLLKRLHDRGMITVSTQEGGDEILFLPVTGDLGYLSDYKDQGRVVCNAQFFLLEFTDAPGPYDLIGEPYGLLISRGELLSPPLYGREALLLDAEGVPSIRCMGPGDLQVSIGGKTYRKGIHYSLFERPLYDRSAEEEGVSLALVGRKIVAARKGGGLDVPHGGFVIHFPHDLDLETEELREIAYSLDRDYPFAIQCGPALISGGEKAASFHSPYYRRRGATYPPTVFPTDWKGGRAARMGIGFKEGRLTALWVEGCKAEFYKPGRDSCGLSLEEFALLCRDLGLEQMVNLDGGGSAQLFYKGEKELRISDRDEKNDDYERPVPLGLALGGTLS